MLFGPQKLHLNFLRELAPVGKWLISKKIKKKEQDLPIYFMNHVCRISQAYHRSDWNIEFLSIEVIGQLKLKKKKFFEVIIVSAHLVQKSFFCLAKFANLKYFVIGFEVNLGMIFSLWHITASQS